MRSILLSCIALALSRPIFSLVLPNSISSREPAVISKNLPRTLGDHTPTSFSDHFEDAPDATAGTHSLPTPPSHLGLRRSSLSPLQRRVSIHTGSWRTSTKIITVKVIVVRTILGTIIPSLLQEAFGVVHDTIAQMNDGIIKPGGFQWISMRNKKVLHVENSNGGELMWGTLEAALQATYGVMSVHEWGTAMITILEDGKEVAKAMIA